MGHIDFDIAASLIIILDIFLFYSRRHLFTPQARMLKALIFLGLGSSTMDILSVVMYWAASSYPLWLSYAVNTAYYVIQNALAPFTCVYILSTTGTLAEMSRTEKSLLQIPWIASLIIILTNPVTKLLFRFDADFVYSRGPLLSALYIVILIYLAVSVAAVISARQRISSLAFRSIAFFLCVIILPACVQILAPSLLVENLGFAIAILVVLLSVNDFDVYVDGLTGLFNKEGLSAQLGTMNGARIPSRAFILSLNNQGLLNQAIGADAFASMDRDLARHLCGKPRPGRFGARLGPGQYAIMLIAPDPPQEQAERDRILQVFDNPWAIGEKQLALSARVCEIGFPGDSRDFRDVFKAHHELSTGKSEYQRNTLLSLADLSLEDSERQIAVSHAIQRALANREGLDVHFQPIVSAKTGEILAAEALIRLTDGSLGKISPAEFVPIAERNGSIHRIGDLVIDRSCAFLTAIRAEGYPLRFLEVNISPIQCIQYHLDERLLSVSRRYGLAGTDLCFEITETAAVLSHATMLKTVNGLHSAGFSIAIDDYGTGHSNISNLASIPFHSVKLDRSLVLAMEKSENGRRGMESTIDMFKSMGVSIVVEGVETKEQFEAVRDMGADLIQGYYFSKPLDAAEFSRFVQQRGGRCT
jgi:EAL domain-containing protein (putative c-di-GMP-specific phosphodiesterase class I)/GGDEF domain-containing protein